MGSTPARDLSERLLDFGVAVLNFLSSLDDNGVARHVSGQLARFATSSGANYEEAQAAESRADFVHKLQIVLKELRETRYWLRLIDKAGLAHNGPNLTTISNEAAELANIIAQPVITAKQHR